jgi:type I restriction enzyme M protein
VPEDELGNAYEYLIKKFADDSGHTAAEFYTNRTVVHLMTQLLDVQAGESIYDPTCGTGGMLISALDEGSERRNGEYRTLKLYGQERNLITSSIARMNLLPARRRGLPRSSGATPWPSPSTSKATACAVRCDPGQSAVLHQAVEPRGLEPTSGAATPRHAAAGPRRLRLPAAHPASLSAKGRCAVLWPHGVLFRNEEQAMRAKMVEQDWVEASSASAPTCSTTRRWSPASSSATARSPPPARARSSSSTR